MLEKISATSQEVALNEEKLEEIKYIPKTILIEICRISKKNSEELIEDIKKRLEPDAMIFVKIFLGQEKMETLSEDNKRILTELYVAWKLYEAMENEKISEDKKETLYKLLENLKGVSSSSRNSENLENDNKYGEIRVY